MPGHYFDGGWHLADAVRPRPQEDVLCVWLSYLDDQRVIYSAWIDVRGRWRFGETGNEITGGCVTHWMRNPPLPPYRTGMPLDHQTMEQCYGNH